MNRTTIPTNTQGNAQSHSLLQTTDATSIRMTTTTTTPPTKIATRSTNQQQSTKNNQSTKRTGVTVRGGPGESVICSGAPSLVAAVTGARTPGASPPQSAEPPTTGRFVAGTPNSFSSASSSATSLCSLSVALQKHTEKWCNLQQTSSATRASVQQEYSRSTGHPHLTAHHSIFQGKTTTIMTKIQKFKIPARTKRLSQ